MNLIHAGNLGLYTGGTPPTCPGGQFPGGSYVEGPFLVTGLMENYVEFDTPGTYTLDVPPDVTEMFLTACGGGGSGGNNFGIAFSGGSGGMAIVRRRIEVLPNRPITIIIGAGGVPSDGGRLNGEATIINNDLTASSFTLLGGLTGSRALTGTIPASTQSVGEGSGGGGLEGGGGGQATRPTGPTAGERGAIGFGGSPAFGFDGTVGTSGQPLFGGGGGSLGGGGNATLRVNQTQTSSGGVSIFLDGRDFSGYPGTPTRGGDGRYGGGGGARDGRGGDGYALFEWV